MRRGVDWLPIHFSLVPSDKPERLIWINRPTRRLGKKNAASAYRAVFLFPLPLVLPDAEPRPALRGSCQLEYRTVLEIVVISVAMLGVASGAVVWLVREAARDRRAQQSERRRHF
jgi:hypothetical protein